MLKTKRINRITETQTDSGFLPKRTYRYQFERYNGKMSNTVERECYTPRYAAAGILLYDPLAKAIAVTEQIRTGAIDNENPWLLELVMGMIDTNESPATVAIREATEEAGAIVKRIIPIYEYYPSPGILSEYVTLFCGEVDITTISGIHGLPEEDEDIKVVTLSLIEAERQLKRGAIKTASTLIALQWLLLHADDLWLM